jgi:hypothetical protein
LLECHQQLIAEGTIASSRLKGLSDYDKTLVRSDAAAAELVNPTQLLSRSWRRHSLLIAISGLSRNSLQLYGGVPTSISSDEEARRRDVPEVQYPKEGYQLVWRFNLTHELMPSGCEPGGLVSSIFVRKTGAARVVSGRAGMSAKPDVGACVLHRHCSTSPVGSEPVVLVQIQAWGIS